MVPVQLAQGSPQNLAKSLLLRSLRTEKEKGAWKRKAETLNKVEYKLREA